MAYQSEFLSARIQTLVNSCLQPSLTHIAGELKVERHTLERVLRKTSGMTFRQLRAESLARRAVLALTGEPGRSVKEISFLLGYKSPRAFSRFVKQSFGVSPGTLRIRGRISPARVIQKRKSLHERMK